MSRNINHDPNNKGENWQQFLKDVQDPQIVGILNDDPAMRLNRKGARALDYNNKAEAMEEAVKKGQQQALEAENIRKGRRLKEGEFFAEVFEALLPGWAYSLMTSGKKWVAPLFGYVWGNTPGNHMEESNDGKVPKLFPCNTCWVARKRFIWFGKPVQVTYMKKDDKGEMVETPGATKFIWEGK